MCGYLTDHFIWEPVTDFLTLIRIRLFGSRNNKWGDSDHKCLKLNANLQLHLQIYKTKQMQIRITNQQTYNLRGAKIKYRYPMFFWLQDQDPESGNKTNVNPQLWSQSCGSEMIFFGSGSDISRAGSGSDSGCNLISEGKAKFVNTTAANIYAAYFFLHRYSWKHFLVYDNDK